MATTSKPIEFEPSSKPAKWVDYFAMTKPTITLLVVVTTIPGLLVNVTELPSMPLIIWTLIGACLSSASAAVFNQVVEYETDQTMARTKSRSVPSGKIHRTTAAMFGGAIGITGFVILYSFATPLAAYVAAAGHFYYVVIYTIWLKKRTVQNIVIGGAAGAVGPLIGAAATTNSLTVTTWLLFTLIFLWTPPHFWALALKYKEDYKSAGIPMYPVVHGDERTRFMMLIYTLSLLPLSYFLTISQGIGVFSAVVTWGMTLVFCYKAFILYRSHNNDEAMPLFHFSCIYTFVIFAAIAAERLMVLIP